MKAVILCSVCALAVTVVMLDPAPAGAATTLTTVQVASGLTRPVLVASPPDDFDRLFILEKAGVIKILNLGTGIVNATAFLNIDALVGGGGSDNDERGLLGLAFHPDYASNGFFYVNYTNNSSDTVVARYTVSANPDIADAGSALTVMTIGQPFTNHNGGWLGFGPQDGYLHIATGDGGSSCDPGQRAQDTTNQLLGKMLRIDIDGDDFPADPNRNYAIPPENPFVLSGGDDEIWAYGLRNPWRSSFDRVTAELYIADVGQGAWEEVDVQRASSRGGENYGWDCMEGNHCATDSGCSPGACTCHSLAVYRGCAIPDLRGTYFYADWCSNQIWSFRFVGGAVSEFQDRTAELAPSGSAITNIASFGEDAAGEVYVVEQDSTGEIFKIVPDGPVDPPTPHDYANDGDVDLDDLERLSNCFGGPDVPFSDCLCDVFDEDADNDVDLDDFAGFQEEFTG
jgi:glucose/arabinose dehydrogenase